MTHADCKIDSVVYYSRALRNRGRLFNLDLATGGKKQLVCPGGSHHYVLAPWKYSDRVTKDVRQALLNGGQIMSSILIIGGSDAGISAALSAKEGDPQVEITVVAADRYPNFSINHINRSATISGVTQFS